MISTEAKKHDIDGKTVLAFHIPPVPHNLKPIYHNSRKNTFIRTGSGNQRASDEEIDSFYRESSFTRKDESETDFPIDLLNASSLEKFRNYLRVSRPGHRYNSLDTPSLLEKLGAMKNGKVTYGGILLFGTEDAVHEITSDFRMEYLEIPGTSYGDGPTRYTFRLEPENNLFDYFFAIMDRLFRRIDIPFKMNANGFRMEDQPHVQAVREALVNLCMHTDYFSPAVPRIRAFHDRLEFFNPGCLPKKLEYIIREDFSLPRNPIISRTFRTMKLAENVGSGFYKMMNGWEGFTGNPLETFEDIDSFRITFRFARRGEGEITAQKTVDKTVEETVEETVDKIINAMRKNPKITQKELCALAGLTRRGIEWNIDKLKKEGRIKRIGPKKGGHWEIIEDDE